MSKKLNIKPPTPEEDVANHMIGSVITTYFTRSTVPINPWWMMKMGCDPAFRNLHGALAKYVKRMNAYAEAWTIRRKTGKWPKGFKS